MSHRSTDAWLRDLGRAAIAESFDDTEHTAMILKREAENERIKEKTRARQQRKLLEAVRAMEKEPVVMEYVRNDITYVAGNSVL